MKTYSLILIFLIALSSASAQDNMETKKIEFPVIVSQNSEGAVLKINDLTIKENLKKTSVVRIESDIKIYLNLLRNVENIDLLFPKINKIVKV